VLGERMHKLCKTLSSMVRLLRLNHSVVATLDPRFHPVLRLTGLGIQTQHCTIARSADKCSITPAESAEVLVNGEKCAAGKAKELSHNDRVRV